MDRKQVGKSDVEISGIGLGTTTFGREIDQDTAFEIMDYAVENGITFLIPQKHMEVVIRMKEENRQTVLPM